MVVVVLSVTSAGADYGAVTGSVPVTIIDDETAEFVIDPSPLTVGENGTADFTVELSSQPTAGVTVSVTSGDTDAAVIVSGATLSFTTGNWDTPRTVRVRGEDDPDPDNESLEITLRGSGGDYTDVTGALAVTVTDDDSPNLIIRPATFRLDEGQSRDFTVKLATLPTAEVTVAVSSGDAGAATVSKDSLTFTTDTWDDLQTVTVESVQDEDAADEPVVISLSATGGDYAGIDGTVPVTVEDDETPDFVIDPASLAFLESGSGTFTVRLRYVPTVNVTVSVTSDDPGAATVSDDSLTFTPADWQTTQEVTVTGVQDSDPDSEMFDVLLSASGGEYTGVSAAVDIEVTDDDIPNLVPSKPSVTIDEGDSDSFTVKLATLPTGDVDVTVTSGDPGALEILQGGSLSFDTGNWNVARPVTLRAAQDDDATEERVTITLSADGGDYAGVGATVQVTVDDDEEAELVIDPTALEVDEGDTGSFTVRLGSQPTAAVNVSLNSPDTGAASLSTGSLSFDSGNWRTERTVTVTGVQDEDSAQESVRVTLLATGGDYGGKEGAVLVTVRDDEAPVPGLVMNPTSLTVDENGSGTFTVKLATAPTATVRVSLSSDRSSIATVSPATLTFTAGNWENERTVTVSGADDSNTANASALITLRASGGDYEGKSGTVGVSVIDDDELAPALVIDPSSVEIREGDSADIRVRLRTQPTAGVSVTARSDDGGAVAVQGGALTFTTQSWQDEQTVQVTGSQDSDSDNESVTVTFTAAGGDYRGRTGTARVEVIDDEASPAMLVVDPPVLRLQEGAAGSFTVSLARAPGGIVTVYVWLYDPDLATVSDVELEFTTSDWQIPQAVTVTALQDEDGADERFRIVTLGSGGGLNEERASVDVRIDDDETPAIVLNQRSLSVAEESFGNVTVSLATRPVADVTVEIGSADATAVTVTPASLTFTASDWRNARTLTVNGVSDSDARGESTSLSLEVTASGRDYENMEEEIRITVRDDDPDIRVSFSEASYDATEGGSDATVVVQLSRADTEDATFSLHMSVPFVNTRESDYSGLPEEVTVGAGQTSASFTIVATDDEVSGETANRLRLELRDIPGGFTTGSPIETTVNLIDNDVSLGPPVFSLASAAVSAEEGDDLVFRVNIRRPTDDHFMFSFWTADGTATRTTDYKAPASVDSEIQGGYGLTSAEIRIPTVDDDIVEVDETFELFLTSSEKATATILDNDNNGQPYVDTIPADSTTTASVGVDGSVKGDLETSDDADWYKATLEKDRCYRIRMTGKDDDTDLTLEDPLIWGITYESDEKAIAGTYSDNFDREERWAQVLLRPKADGTYYIDVRQSDRDRTYPDGGSYRLSLEDLGTERKRCGYDY